MEIGHPALLIRWGNPSGFHVCMKTWHARNQPLKNEVTYCDRCRPDRLQKLNHVRVQRQQGLLAVFRGGCSGANQRIHCGKIYVPPLDLLQFSTTEPCESSSDINHGTPARDLPQPLDFIHCKGTALSRLCALRRDLRNMRQWIHRKTAGTEQPIYERRKRPVVLVDRLGMKGLLPTPSLETIAPNVLRKRPSARLKKCGQLLLQPLNILGGLALLFLRIKEIVQVQKQLFLAGVSLCFRWAKAVTFKLCLFEKLLGILRRSLFRAASC
ncbi:hypothetical protein [Prosthecobacter sp.]|uniref:hypothetical protein n=1 Tax=Prosthecobacter sp. TaxID=1965333 RepID=UPI0025E289EC|nr:hypothetical protein [Prosthecobacter sp.]